MPRTYPERDQQIKKLLEQGYTNKAIAEAFGLKPNSIVLIKRRLGFEIKNGAAGRWASADKKKIEAPPPTPLSPAMRHLAKFDDIIARRLELEERQKSGEGR